MKASFVSVIAAATLAACAHHAVDQMAAPGRTHYGVAEGGSIADRVDLPKAGIRGNSHMLMMDQNSDQIAQLVQDWMVKNGLMK